MAKIDTEIPVTATTTNGYSSTNGETTKSSQPPSEGLLELISALKDEDCIRGVTPENIEKQCLEMCQSFIGGNWSLVTDTSKQIKVTRISGGLTNQLYRVELLVDSLPVQKKKNSFYKYRNFSKEPTDVAIKLYMPKHLISYHELEPERHNDTISLTILSEVGLGPRVLGISDQGFIQEYHENEQFTLKYQSDSEKLREVIYSLAKFNYLNVPIRKNSNWVYNDTLRSFNIAYNELNIQKLIDETDGVELLKIHDPRKELIELEEYIRQVDSPVVFCHNDFRGSNILVTKPSGKILLVDAEYCQFGQRGHDLANILHEYGHEPFDFANHELPADEIIERYAQLYLDGCEQIMPGYCEDPDNSLEKLVREIKVNALALGLFVVGFMIRSKDNIVESIPFDPVSNLIGCEFSYKKYFNIKNRLIQDGTIIPVVGTVDKNNNK